MTRWFLFRSSPVSIMIHCFHRSDMDRAFHDHPWDFITVLLSSGYREHTPKGAFWRRRFSILYRPAVWQHWVEVTKPTWTLVVKFKTFREWGFITKHGWVHWKAFDYQERCG